MVDAIERQTRLAERARIALAREGRGLKPLHPGETVATRNAARS
jgi:hypothetical protein